MFPSEISFRASPVYPEPEQVLIDAPAEIIGNCFRIGLLGTTARLSSYRNVNGGKKTRELIRCNSSCRTHHIIERAFAEQ